MSEDIVWSFTINGDFAVTITRTGPYAYDGEFAIAECGEVIHRRPVCLTADARPRPAAADVNLWHRLAVDFIKGRLSGEQTR